MDNAYRHSSFPSPAGFTLSEMLVAVGMGAMLIAAAAGIFSIATKAVGSSQANTQINNQLRVLFSWLDRDFARIRLDGPLELNTQSGDLDGKDGTTADERIDDMYFLISGDIRSMFADYHAGLAIVLYGPDDSVDSRPLDPPYDWVLTRRSTLIVGDPTPTEADVEDSSFAELMDDFAAQSGTAWVAAISNRPDVAVGSEPHTNMLSNVTNFKILRYYLASDTGPTDLTAGSTKTFSATDEKPAWIEFEITMWNPSSREAQTSTYRVNLPRR